MQWLLVLLSATALLAETPENPIDCAMAQHYRKKIENFHKELRSGIPEAKYDCELERKARLDKIDGYGTIKINLPKNNGKSVDENLKEAFTKLPEGKKLRQIKDPQVTKYGCWGKFYSQIYNQLSVVCIYDHK
ncbi:hypothetical protein Y032_0009g830 [Ancylostoma ceylanicum]|nr:hypothetical protein Y032_0009g830 [Ancylostoma ceylanicum]